MLLANSQSGGDWELEQTPAVLLPTLVIQCGGSGTECTGELRRRETRERPMHAMAVVVIPYHGRPCLQDCTARVDYVTLGIRHSKASDCGNYRVPIT